MMPDPFPQSQRAELGTLKVQLKLNLLLRVYPNKQKFYTETNFGNFYNG